MRRRTSIQRALQGINASVVGILLAALYDAVWTASIRSTGDFALALVAFSLLIFWMQSPLRVVVLTALGGAALAMFYPMWAAQPRPAERAPRCAMLAVDYPSSLSDLS